MKNIPATQNDKWLIIFLIYADFTTSDELPKIKKLKLMLDDLLGEIMNTPVNMEISRTFVALNSIRFVQDNAKEKIANETMLYDIRSDGNDNFIYDCTIIDNSIYYQQHSSSGQTLRKPDMLIDLFKLTELKSDEELFLMTWDHGSAFGIFLQEPAALDASVVRTRVDHTLYRYPYLSLFWEFAQQKIGADTNPLENELLPYKYIHLQLGRHLLKMENTSLNLRTFDYFKKTGAECHYNEKQGKIILSEIDHGPLSLFENNISNLQPQQGMERTQPGGISSEIDVIPLLPEILKNSELRQALEKWLNGRKVGVLVMANCWMMNMHSMFAFKDTVKYFVAPQGNIDLPGYNIRDILGEINRGGNTGPTPAEVASVCISTFNNAYAQAKAVMHCPEDPNVLDRFKIFAVNLARSTDGKSNLELQIVLLKKLIGQFNEILTKQWAVDHELKYFFKYIRSTCFDFSDGETIMIDIINWIQSLVYANNHLPRVEMKLPGLLTQPMADFEQSVADQGTTIIINKTNGSRLYEKEPKVKIDVATIQLPSTGYSIFFPIADHSSVLQLKDNILSDDLLKQLSVWKDFLASIEPRTTAIFKPFISPQT